MLLLILTFLLCVCIVNVPPNVSNDSFETNSDRNCYVLQVKSGSIFDNVLVTDDEKFAEEFGDKTWGASKDGEKKMKEDHDEDERKQREEEEKNQKDGQYTCMSYVKFSFTVKPVFSMCPLFCDLDDFAKIIGHKYSTSYAIFSVLLSSASKFKKQPKLRVLQYRHLIV